MSDENVALIRSVYDAFARGDVDSVLGAMSDDIVWYEDENFPLAEGNPYRGPQSVASGVFAKLMDEWDDFAVLPEEFIGSGDTVVVLGRYRGTHKATGRSMNPQMAHVWRVSGGKVAAFQQYVDTLAVARASGAV